MSAADHWVEASAWAADRFTCDALPKDGCRQPIGWILVREGEPQAGYCTPHYLEATRPPSPTPGAAKGEP